MGTGSDSQGGSGFFSISQNTHLQRVSGEWAQNRKYQELSKTVWFSETLAKSVVPKIFIHFSGHFFQKKISRKNGRDWSMLEIRHTEVIHVALWICYVSVAWKITIFLICVLTKSLDNFWQNELCRNIVRQNLASLVRLKMFEEFPKNLIFQGSIFCSLKYVQ